MASRTGHYAAVCQVLSEVIGRVEALEYEQYQHDLMFRQSALAGFSVPAKFITADGLECIESIAGLQAGDPCLRIIERPIKAPARIAFSDFNDKLSGKRRYELKCNTPHGIPIYEEVT